jgi:ABC-type transport system involved in Fe-S cluster assembly fused permease/ATPase subunit
MSSVSKNILTLLAYVWKHKAAQGQWRVAITLLLVLLTIAFKLSIPLIFKAIVNALLEPKAAHSDYILLLLIAYGACWLVASFCEKLREMVSYRSVSSVITAYSLDVFRHIHALSLTFHLDRETGKVSGAIQRAQLAIAMIITNVMFRILPVFIEAVMAFVILWHVIGFAISAIVIMVLVLYLLLNNVVIGIFKTADKEYQAIDIVVDKRVVDSLLNSENIKYLNAEQNELRIADTLFRKREKAIIKVFWAGTFATTFQVALLGLGLTVVSCLLGREVLSGHLGVGDFVLVNGYLILLFNPLESITGFIRSTISYSGDLSHSLQLLQECHTINDVPNAKDIVIHDAKVVFNKVSFRYACKHNKVLSDFSLTIAAKSTVAIVGASGSGKSTISSLLFRFYDVNEGAILIDDQDIRRVTKKSLSDQLAFVPQDIVLLNESIKYNICYGSFSASMDQINAVIKAVHLQSLIEKLPQGLDTVVGERGVKLSGGEKQRIAIARALLREPKVIVFDEATSSLDTQTEKIIQANIEDVTKDMTTILIAHRLSTIKHADKIVVLEQGRIIEEGTHDALLALKGRYYKLWEHQHEAR